MKKSNLIFGILLLVGFFSFTSVVSQVKPNKQKSSSETFEKVMLKSIETPVETPNDAIEELRRGNSRFLSNSPVNTHYKEQIEATKGDQHPHSIILSCINSRIPPEIIFDQGIGKVFVARVAGNIQNPDILGSLEFATKVKGSKLIVVMGHNKCGAIKGALDNVQLGNLTQLVNQIKPAIPTESEDVETKSMKTAKENVRITIASILKNSEVIRELVTSGKVRIIGAFYDVTTGKVTFNE